MGQVCLEGVPCSLSAGIQCRVHALFLERTQQGYGKARLQGGFAAGKRHPAAGFFEVDAVLEDL